MKQQRLVAAMIVSAVFVVACGADSEVSPETATSLAVPSPSPSASGLEGQFTLATSFDWLATGYWVPVERNGQRIEAVQGEYWTFRSDNGAVSLRGYDGCNSFHTETPTDGDPLVLESGHLIGVNLVGTLVDCWSAASDRLPREGSQIWVDEDRLEVMVVTEGETLLFSRVDAKPRSISAADERAQAEEFAEEPERDQEQQDQQASFDAARVELRTSLPVMRELWESTGIDSYDLNFLVGCLQCATFPPTQFDQVTTVRVVGGSAESDWNDAATGATVDDWFGFIDAALDDAYMIDVEFDAALGYPTRIAYVSREWTTPDDPAIYEDYVLYDAVVVPVAG